MLFWHIDRTDQVWLAISVQPNRPFPTAEAYQWIVPKPASFDLRLLPTVPKEKWKDVLRNDFEEGAIAKHPIIGAHIQDHYDRGAFYAAMSGSGSSVFGLY